MISAERLKMGNNNEMKSMGGDIQYFVNNMMEVMAGPSDYTPGSKLLFLLPHQSILLGCILGVVAYSSYRQVHHSVLCGSSAIVGQHTIS
jgi:hypothetical protein